MSLSPVGIVSKVPSRPLPKFTGPGRRGQERGRPQVSVHPQGVAWSSGWEGRGGTLSAACTLRDAGVNSLGTRPSPLGRARPPPPGSAEPSVPQGLGSGQVLAVTCPYAPPRASSSEPLSAKTCSLFPPSCMQDKYLLQLLRSADDVSTWVAAEIVTSHTPKVGASQLQPAQAWGTGVGGQHSCGLHARCTEPTPSHGGQGWSSCCQ